MWESQVLLTDGQVVFLRVLRFSPIFDERSARYKWNILERAVKPKSKKKKKNCTQSSPLYRGNRCVYRSLYANWAFYSSNKINISLIKSISHLFKVIIINTWTAASEKEPSSLRKMYRFRSSCACAKYHLGLCSAFIHFIISNCPVSGERKPWSGCTDVQAYMCLCFWLMPKDTFSHDALNRKTVIRNRYNYLTPSVPRQQRERRTHLM